jgi:AraC-like DNA-binding protein
MEDMRFSVPEILSLVGLIQCVYVLVYMLFRAGDVRRAVLPSLYFVVLGLAFFLDFARDHVGAMFDYYLVLPWAAWFMGPPLSVLLMIQIAQISQVPPRRYFFLPLLLPIAAAVAISMARRDTNCELPGNCPVLREWLVIFGLVAGLVSIAILWARRSLLRGLKAEKAGSARYWLILTLIFVNLSFLTVMLLSLTPALGIEEMRMIRTFLGLGLVYVAGTSLFRIYPQAVQIVERGNREMNPEEKNIAQRIEGLLTLEKIYQEPHYTRADLARELKLPESVVSRVINVHFGKSFPQLLNEKRVADATKLLAESNLAIKDVAEQVGFNSTASFNRVFRSLTGKTPSTYRKLETGTGEANKA